MSSPSRSEPQKPGETYAGPVLFFDGECGLCNRLVRGLVRLDRAGRLRFAPLQGPMARSYLRAHGLPLADFDSLIFVPSWAGRARPDHLVRTAGVIAALRVVGGVARVFAAVLALLPARVRDFGYRVVGRTRYALFGPWRSRPLARADWAARFFE